MQAINLSLGTDNTVLLTLNFQMYNIAKHTYITSFWAVYHSTSTRRTHAQIKRNTLLETTVTFLMHFSEISRELGKVMDLTLGFWQHTAEPKYSWQGQKSRICCRSVPKKYCNNTFAIPKFSQVTMISLQLTVGYHGLHKTFVHRPLVWTYPCDCKSFVGCTKFFLHKNARKNANAFNQSVLLCIIKFSIPVISC